MNVVKTELGGLEAEVGGHPAQITSWRHRMTLWGEREMRVGRQERQRGLHDEVIRVLRKNLRRGNPDVLLASWFDYLLLYTLLQENNTKTNVNLTRKVVLLHYISDNFAMIRYILIFNASIWQEISQTFQVLEHHDRCRIIVHHNSHIERQLSVMMMILVMITVAIQLLDESSK